MIQQMKMGSDSAVFVQIVVFFFFFTLFRFNLKLVVFLGELLLWQLKMAEFLRAFACFALL